MGSIIHVYLITGFLGSGKTTFLNRIINSFPRDMKLMILMNEFGEVGVDGTLVEGEDIDMMEISKGSIFCVCVKTDFIKGLNEIAQKVQPDILLIESTGVANPVDLKRDLALPFFKDRFRLEEQFCIIDAVHFRDEYQTFASVEKQISSSTRFIINKIDLAQPEQILEVKRLVNEHHPAPDFYETTYTQVPLDRLFQGIISENGVEIEQDIEFLTPEEIEEAVDRLLDDPNREVVPPDRLLSAVYEWSGNQLADFQSFIEKLPATVVRAKGFLEVEGKVHLFSLVMGQRELKTATLPEDRHHLLNHLVFIAPPEAMAEMEALSKEMPMFTRKSLLDPMANQS